jgi:hypothetical protein
VGSGCSQAAWIKAQGRDAWKKPGERAAVPMLVLVLPFMAMWSLTDTGPLFPFCNGILRTGGSSQGEGVWGLTNGHTQQEENYNLSWHCGWGIPYNEHRNTDLFLAIKTLSPPEKEGNFLSSLSSMALPCPKSVNSYHSWQLHISPLAPRIKMLAHCCNPHFPAMAPPSICLLNLHSCRKIWFNLPG